MSCLKNTRNHSGNSVSLNRQPQTAVFSNKNTLFYPNELNFVPGQVKNWIFNVIWSSFVFSELRREVVVCFVDIGGIDDYHCLNFLFIIQIQFINHCRGIKINCYKTILLPCLFIDSTVFTWKSLLFPGYIC